MEFGSIVIPVYSFQQDGSPMTLILSRFITRNCKLLGRKQALKSPTLHAIAVRCQPLSVPMRMVKTNFNIVQKKIQHIFY